MVKPFIGVSGKSGSGKDTVADYLLTKGWDRKFSFGDPLKNICSEVFGIDLCVFYDRDLKEKPFDEHLLITSRQAHEVVKLAFESDCIFLWDTMEIIRTPRILLQSVGTGLLRHLNQDCHVDMFKKVVGDDFSSLVVPDVRFPNEGDFILDRDGILIRVERPDQQHVVGSHESETLLDCYDKFSYTINNDSSGLDSLYNKVDVMLNYLGLEE